MKLNLTLGHPPINGYLNVDPFFDHDGKTKCDLDKLECVDDGECSEILAIDVLEYVPVPIADQTLTHWVSKLAHKGVLVIGGTNLRQVCKCILDKTLDIDRANQILYGEQRFPGDLKYGMVDMERLCAALQTKGLKVISKQLDGLKMIVKGERQ